MKNRQLVLLATTCIVVAGYLGFLLNEDTLPKAANRFGKAVLASDTKTIWSLVPDEEKARYQFDEGKFSSFWTKVIQPHLKNLDSFRLQSANNNGLIVICHSAKASATAPEFGILISGQLGTYNAPYLVAYASLASAGLDMKSSNTPKFERFQQYIKWIDQNRSVLQSLGITKIKRGPEFPMETLDAMKVHFSKIAEYERARIQVAAR